MRRAVLAAALLTAGCAASQQPAPPAPSPAPAPANVAYVDPQATSDAMSGIKKAVEAAFSYDSTKPDEVAKTEQEYLTGGARAQFDKTFAEVRAEPVTTQTQVMETGLAELTPDHARMLVAATQHSKRPDGAKNQAGALMLVTAVRTSGHWQLEDLNFDPRGPIASAAAPAKGLAANRDSAVEAARRDGGVLMTVDPQNIDGNYAAWENVAAEPLLTEFRKSRQETVDRIKQTGTKATYGADSTAALTQISPDGTHASALLAAQLTTTGGQHPGANRLPVHLDLVRQGSEWKVSGMKAITASGS
ncbi:MULTISPECIES: hypothetical protein [Actinomycetes]|uniref:hypothetical protein n=1 Tax=Actinomycetes TaxID=1760 RepID=UPI0018F8A226|nr:MULTISPECIES: hypothetical protein [Actinomycetes]